MKKIVASMVCFTAVLNFGMTSIAVAETATKSHVSKNQSAKDEASKLFGEQLLLKLTEPPVKPSTRSTSVGDKPRLLMKGTVLHNEVVDTFERLGLACAIRPTSAGNLLVVYKVKPGGPAYFGGLVANDIIDRVSVIGNALVMDVKRPPAVYRLKLDAGNVRLHNEEFAAFLTQLRHAKLSAPSANSQIVAGAPSNDTPIMTRLGAYDVDLILDFDGSTTTPKRLSWLAAQLNAAKRSVTKNGGVLHVSGKSGSVDSKVGTRAIRLDKTLATTKPFADINVELAKQVQALTLITKKQQRPILIAVIHDKSVQTLKTLDAVNDALSKLTEEREEAPSDDKKPESDQTADSVATPDHREIQVVFVNITDAKSTILDSLLNKNLEETTKNHIRMVPNYSTLVKDGIENSLIGP